MNYLYYLFLIQLQGSIYLTPNNADWEVFNADFDTYYLSTGNYEDLGRIIIKDKNNFKIIGDSSIVQDIELIRCNNVTIEGVTVTTYGVILRRSEHCTVRNSYFHLDRRINVRVIHSPFSNIENNYMRIDSPYTDATVGILLEGNSPECRVVGNTIINYVDGIGSMDKPTYEINDLQGLLVANNEIYIEDKLRQSVNGEEYAVTENAIDLKVGSENPDNPVIIRGNKLHGHRWTKKGSSSGSGGEEIVIHRYAKNIVIEENEIYDGVGAIRVAPTVVNGKWFYPNNRRVVIRNNKIHHIFKRNEPGKGAVYYIASETEIENNQESDYSNLLYNVHVKTKIK